MKTTLKNVILFIIDEVSMVSNLNLTYIHLRLDELFGGNDWFRSKSILFVGDLLQLQPVNGDPAYENITQKSLAIKVGCVTSVNIWKDAFIYEELTENVRQKVDCQYACLLDAVRCSQLTENIKTVLQQKVIDKPLTELFAKLQNIKKSPVCLFLTRRQFNDFNITILAHLTSEMYEIPCIDEVKDTMSTTKWIKQAVKRLQN